MKHIGFGAGGILLSANDNFVRGLSYLVDNHPQKLGRKLAHLEIFNPDILLNEDKEKIFIWVLTKDHGATIKSQLRKMGFTEGRHFVSIFDLYRHNEISELFGQGSAITLSAPKIIRHGGRSRLTCEFNDNGEQIQLWYEVDGKYEQYLLHERSDAFLVCLLWYAMRSGRDIVCTAPVTEELLYNIETLIIPTLTKHSTSKLYPTKIHCATESKSLENACGVGTGLSCGIDSFHAIMNHLNPKYKSMKLTHLCIFNTSVTYNGGMGANVNAIRTKRFELARKAAEELELPLVEVDTNLASAILTNHADSNTFMNFSVVFALKKLWKTYYYGSTYNISMFSAGQGSGFNDLLLAYCCSDSHMRFYIEGVEKTRPEKVVDVSDFPIARKYLRVCALKDVNCNVCSQCRRTMIELEMADKLEEFRNAFDVDYYYEHRHEYYKEVYNLYQSGDARAKETIGHIMNHLDQVCK